jgi:RNA-binding protein
MKKEIKELRSQAKKLEPIVRIGKNGLTEGMLKQLYGLLEHKVLIKVKLLKSSFVGNEKEKFIEELVMKTQSQLVDSIGNVVVLYKKP